MKKDSIVKLIAGLEVVLEVLREEVGQTPAKNVEAPKETKKADTTPVKEEVAEVVAESPKANDREAELTNMAFNDLKKYAKEIGVSATGTKAQIVAKVLEAEANTTGAEEEVVEDSPVEVSDAQEDTTEDATEDANAEDAPEETLADKVARELEGTSDAELKEILASVGIKALGKRQALLDKIVKAIEEGKLDFGDDDAEAENGSNEEDADEIPGSPERLEAMDALYAELKTAYDKKEITDKEIAEFLKKYYDGKPPKATKEEKLEDYLAIQVSLIDDDGEQHDLEDAYYVGEVVYCCGAPVKELDNGNVTCEICGQEYEV